MRPSSRWRAITTPPIIEPYQGAATGVGGILRDVFTMGARPIAAMNALRFGDRRTIPRPAIWSPASWLELAAMATRSACQRWAVRSTSTPATMATSWSTPSPLGLGRSADKIFLSESQRGRTCPSFTLAPRPAGTVFTAPPWRLPRVCREDSEEKRPTVQVGDPFTEKCLLEACLELMQPQALSSPFRTWAQLASPVRQWKWAPKAHLGIDLDLDQRAGAGKRRMSAYEMMLSESQERMLMVLQS